MSEPAPAAAPTAAPTASWARPRWAEVAAAAALAAVSLALFARGQYRGVRMSDDFEYAHVARNVLRGRGFETQQLNPLDLAFFEGVPHANVLHPPGTPLLIAPSFALFGVSDLAAVLPMMAAFVALAAVVFVLAHRLFGRGAAWCAAGLFAVHPECLRWATVAMAEVPSALCLTSAALAVLAARGRRGLFAGGLLCGAAVWFRENLATFGGALLVLAWATGEGTARERLRRCVPVVAGIAVPVALLSVRSMVAFGRPWFSYSTYHVQGYSLPYDPALFDGVEIFRHLRPPTFLETLTAHPGAIARKVLDNLLGAPKTFAEAAWLPATVLVSAHLVLPARRETAAVKAALGTALALHFAAHAAFVNNTRHLAPYLPLVIALAGGAAAAALGPSLRRTPRPARWVAGAAVAVLAASTLWTWRSYAFSDWRTNQWDGLGPWVAAQTPADAVVATDQFEPVVWQGDRRAIVLPVDRPSFDEIRRRVPPTHLLVTSRLSIYPKTAWVTEMLAAPGAGGWTETARFDDGKVRAVLYARAE